MATAQGINTDRCKIIALALSNGLAALSGSIIAQYMEQGEVSIGSGAIVIGLASIVIGELVFGSKFSFWEKLIGVVIGSLIYRLIFVVALQLGLKTDDLKLIATIIIIIALCLPELKKKILSKKADKGGKENA